MEDKNACIVNEVTTLWEHVNVLSSQAARLTPDNTTLNSATLRSLNNEAEAIRGELVNLQNLLDTYPQ